MIPFNRIDDISERVRWEEPLDPDFFREFFVDLIISIHELDTRLKKLEGLASQPQWIGGA